MYLSTSSTETGTPSTPSAFAQLANVGDEARVADPVRVRDEVRLEEEEERRQPHEHEAAGDPPPVADQASEAHDDEHGHGQEHELDAELEPAAEDLVEVPHVRDAVPAVPPVPRHLERDLDEPEDAEAEHREQHPRADRAGGRLTDEARPLTAYHPSTARRTTVESSQLMRWKRS